MTAAPKRRRLLALLIVAGFVAALYVSADLAARFTEVQSARRHYESAREFHGADSVDDQYLYEVSLELLGAESRLPFWSYKDAAHGHVARIEAMRSEFVKIAPGYDR